MLFKPHHQRQTKIEALDRSRICTYSMIARAYDHNSARERPPQSEKNIVDVTAECKLSWF